MSKKLKLNSVYLKLGQKLECQNEDEEGYPKPITIEGYSGGRVHFYGDDFIFDLSNMKCDSERMPILLEHDRSKLVGRVREIETSPQLVLKGKIYDTEAGRTVAIAEDDDFGYQASVGLDPHEVNYVPEGESIVVNGRKEEGPVCVVSSTLKEISCVIWGKDSNTSVSMSEIDCNKLLLEAKTDNPEPREEEEMVNPEETQCSMADDTQPSASPATLSELKREFKDASDFILEAMEKGWTLLEAKEEYVNRDREQLEAEREEFRKRYEAFETEIKKRTGAEGQDPIESTEEPTGLTADAPGTSITMKGLQHVSCSEPFTTGEDLQMYELYGKGGCRIFGDLERSHNGFDHIPL